MQTAAAAADMFLVVSSSFQSRGESLEDFAERQRDPGERHAVLDLDLPGDDRKLWLLAETRQAHSQGCRGR